LIVPLQPSPFR